MYAKAAGLVLISLGILCAISAQEAVVSPQSPPLSPNVDGPEVLTLKPSGNVTGELSDKVSKSLPNCNADYSNIPCLNYKLVVPKGTSSTPEPPKAAAVSSAAMVGSSAASVGDGVEYDDEMYTNIMNMCLSAAWYTANLRTGHDSDAGRDHARFNQYSMNVDDDIKWMCWNAAWQAANTRFGHSSEVEGNVRDANHHLDNMVHKGIPNAQTISDMGWHMGWYASNYRAGGTHLEVDAPFDRQRYQTEYRSLLASNIQACAMYHVISLCAAGTDCGSTYSHELTTGWDTENTLGVEATASITAEIFMVTAEMSTGLRNSLSTSQTSRDTKTVSMRMDSLPNDDQYMVQAQVAVSDVYDANQNQDSNFNILGNTLAVLLGPLPELLCV